MNLITWQRTIHANSPASYMASHPAALRLTRSINLITLCIAGVLITGCGRDQATPGHTGDSLARSADTTATSAKRSDGAQQGDEEEESSEVKITPAMMKESGVNVGRVMEEPVSALVSAPARVIPTQSGIAHVGTVIPGRITRLFVSEGSYVNRGTALAELEALDIGDIKAAYLRARAEVERTRAALDRSTKLSGEGIGATRVLEEARTAYRQAIAEQNQAETKLRTLGINPAGLHSGIEKPQSFSSRVVLRAPIAGIVARLTVTLGEFIEPRGDAFELINTRTVWVDAQVQPEMASQLTIGGVGFISNAKGERRAGQVIFISPSLDSASRTVTARIELSNSDNAFRPETFVTAEFETAITGSALTVPSEAIEQEGGRFYVYREHEPSTFTYVEVEVGARTDKTTVIRNGLKKDDRIAISGLFYLRSTRQKGKLAEED